MTGELDYRVYEDAGHKLLSDKFDHDCRETRYEHGHGGNTGTIADLHGVSRFHDARFESEEAAAAFLRENHTDNGEALAVSFVMHEPWTEDDEDRAETFRERVVSWQTRLVEAQAKAVERFKARTSEFVGCSGCKSRLAKSLVEARWCETAPTCPLCDQNLASKVDLIRIEKLRARIEKAEKDLVEATTPRPSDKVAWIIGGMVEE